MNVLCLFYLRDNLLRKVEYHYYYNEGQKTDPAWPFMKLSTVELKQEVKDPDSDLQDKLSQKNKAEKCMGKINISCYT